MPYNRNRNNPGLEAALKHIEEAEELSVTLGGTDQDVKRYFFSLTQEQLRPILDAYEIEHGRGPRLYAEKAMPNWKTGKTQMSGLVAGRLFGLLPPFMPIPVKYELVKTLWEKMCPSSRKTFYVGTDVDKVEVCNRVREHLTGIVKDYEIPESIASRFKWLAKNDVGLQQELHNYFLQLNREAVSQAADNRIPMLIEQLSSNMAVNQQVTQEIDVANHRVTLVFHSMGTGLSTVNPSVSQNRIDSVSNEGAFWGWVIAIAIGIVVWVFIANAG